jgi:hypothetical protein
MSTTHHDMGNNETLSTGINALPDGTFLALTLTASKSFKTERGAVRWLDARGYRADGTRAAR